MEQVDSTVARHISRTSPPNERESTALVILFWISIDRSRENVTLRKEKAAHLRLVRVATPTVRLARHSPEGTRVVLQFH